jgi:hypothetical protein
VGRALGSGPVQPAWWSRRALTGSRARHQGGQPHVPPLGDVGADLRTRLEYKGFQAAVEQVGGGGQPDRPDPDHHHRESGLGGEVASGLSTQAGWSLSCGMGAPQILNR